MTAVFDWSGAPEGERWVVPGLGRTRMAFVIDDDETVYVQTHATERWDPAAASSSWIRSDGTRVDDEPARPVVRVGDRVRVTIEGVLIDTYEGETCFDIRPDGDPDARRFFWPEQDGAQVEVMERADPPLEPGDLVRDSDRDVWWVNAKREFVRTFWASGAPAPDEPPCKRDDLSGPLVKVELDAVFDAGSSPAETDGPVERCAHNLGTRPDPLDRPCTCTLPQGHDGAHQCDRDHGVSVPVRPGNSLWPPMQPIPATFRAETDGPAGGQ